jgi:hypothetical protein
MGHQPPRLPPDDLPGGVNSGTLSSGRGIDSLLEELRRSPTGVRLRDACKVATHFFGQPRQRGSSHEVWKMPWAGDPRINLQPAPDGKAKAYQVRQLVRAVDRLLQERTP